MEQQLLQIVSESKVVKPFQETGYSLSHEYMATGRGYIIPSGLSGQADKDDIH